MRNLLLIASAAVALAGTAAPAAAQSAADARFRTAQQRFDREYQIYRDEVERYAAARRQGAYAPPPRGDYRGGPDGYDDADYYDPAPDYRAGGQYRERVLTRDERVYAGEDGRYYCRRGDGTTGLIVGAAGGGILGNVIDGGRSRTVGTLLGGALGALAGRAVQQNQEQIRCR